MPTNGDTAEAVSRNVWMLGQLRGYSSKAEMAAAMGWDPSRFSRTLGGKRQWTLEDLVTVADVLGLAGPGELFRPLGELVGAIQPTAASGATAPGRIAYATSQQSRLPRSAASGTRHLRLIPGALPTRPITPRGRRHVTTVVRPCDASSAGVSPVTSAVGL